MRLQAGRLNGCSEALLKLLINVDIKGSNYPFFMDCLPTKKNHCVDSDNTCMHIQPTLLLDSLLNSFIFSYYIIVYSAWQAGSIAVITYSLKTNGSLHRNVDIRCGSFFMPSAIVHIMMHITP